MLKQSAALTDALLNGNSVIELQAIDTSSTPPLSDVQAGIINANGSGSFTLAIEESDGGTFDSGTGNPQSLSGNYSVDTTSGRVTLSNIIGGGGGSNVPIFYLAGLNQAFVIDTGSKVSFGTIMPQTGSGFTNASLSRNYLGGSQRLVTANGSVEVDQISANGAGNLAGTSDNNNNGCGSGNACPASSTITGATYSVSSNGRVILSQGVVQGGVNLYALVLPGRVPVNAR